MITLSHIETDITSACNNCCVGCDHYSGLLAPHMVPVEDIQRDVLAARQLFHVKEYSLLGGEPTLHPQLLEILDIIHSLNFAETVQVITNGQTLRKLPEAFWEKIDSLWVTRYPGKLTDLDVEWIQQKCQQYGKPYLQKNRGTLVKTFSSRTAAAGEAQHRFNSCHLRHCNVMDGGYLHQCCAGPFVAPLIMGLPEGTDGLKLEGASELDLQAYLTRVDAFEGCKHCVELYGVSYPWRETTRAQWRAESESDL